MSNSKTGDNDQAPQNLDFGIFHQLSINLLGTLSHEGYLGSLNPAWQSLLNRPLESLTSKSLTEFIHPTYHSQLSNALHQCRQRPTSVEIEAPLQTARGFIGCKWRFLYKADSQLVYFSATPNETSQAFHNLKSVINSLSDNIFLLDRDGCFVAFYPDKDSTSLYIQPSEFLGRHYSAIMPSEISLQIDQAIEEINQNDTVAQFDYSLVVDGQLRWYNTKISLLKDEFNTLIGYTALARDITLRKNYEAQALQATHLHRAIAKNLPRSALIVFDRDFRYLLLEGEALAEAGYNEPQMVGKTIWELLPPSSVDALLPYYQSALDGQPVAFERVSNGHTYHVNIVPIITDQETIEQGLIVVTDITQLRTAETYLRNMLNSLFVYAAVLAPDGTVLETNDLALKTSNLSASDVIGKHFEETYWWIYSSQIQSLIQQSIKQANQGKRIRFDTRARLADNQISHMDFMLAPVTNASGEITHLVASGVDISSRIETQAALEKSLLRLSTLYRTSSQLMRVKSQKELLQVVVENAADVVGADRATIIMLDTGRNEVVEFVSGGKGKAQNIHVQTEELFEGLTGWVLRKNESALSPKDRPDPRESLSVQQRRIEQNCGSIIVVPVSVGDIVLGTLTTIRLPEDEDFTEEDVEILLALANQVAVVLDNLKLVELLQKSGRKYRQLVDSATDMVYQTDVDGHFTFVNPVASNVSGYSQDELIGKDYLTLVHPDFRAHAQETFRRQVENQEEEIYLEFPFQTKNGDLVWIGQNVQLIFDSTEPPSMVGFQGIARDITERRRIEEERERLINDLNAFAHTVAHDLKNPLNVVVGYSEVLRDTEDLPEEVYKYLDSIVRSSYGMNRIIDELLRLAEIRTLEDIQLETLHTPQLVADALERMDVLIKKANAEIIMPSTWHEAQGYAGWVGEVWANYISNAVKYGGSPPHIVLGSDLLPNKHVKYWVRDNGAGIPLEQQSKLFQQFSRLDKVRATGHGLGLSIVKRIMDRLGGEVGVTNLPEGGSEFYFILPEASANQS